MKRIMTKRKMYVRPENVWDGVDSIHVTSARKQII